MLKWYAKKAHEKACEENAAARRRKTAGTCGARREAERMSDYRALTIGEKAPHFQATTTFGPVNFPEDYRGKWVVFFSHPGDFTPVAG